MIRRVFAYSVAFVSAVPQLPWGGHDDREPHLIRRYTCSCRRGRRLDAATNLQLAGSVVSLERGRSSTPRSGRAITTAPLRPRFGAALLPARRRWRAARRGQRRLRGHCGVIQVPAEPVDETISSARGRGAVALVSPRSRRARGSGSSTSARLGALASRSGAGSEVGGNLTQRAGVPFTCNVRTTARGVLVGCDGCPACPPQASSTSPAHSVIQPPGCGHRLGCGAPRRCWHYTPLASYF